MPAKASDPPDGISTVVSARRVLSEGMVIPPGTVKAPTVESSDISVITFRLMRPSDNTTGVNTRLTPHFLKSTCGVKSGGPLVPFTYGNSPPARKLAVSPEIAVKLGSAKVRMTPALSIARTVAVTFLNAPVSALLGAGGLTENGLVVLKFTTAAP